MMSIVAFIGSAVSVTSNAEPVIRAFFDPPTETISYLVADPATAQAFVIDPVLDYDQAAGMVDTRSAEAMVRAAETEGCRIVWTLETHAHADHLSASAYLRARTGAKIGIGARIVEVQNVFAPRFNVMDLKAGGRDFDLLFEDGDRFWIGQIDVEVLDTPGHTSADVSYKVGNAVFVGDTLFMPDYGTARTDFPGGDAARLYRSINRILALPPGTRLFMCHDYKAPGRDRYEWESTVEAQKQANVHLRDGIDEAAFVALRKARDATLNPPRLLLPAIQVNIRAGKFPPPDDNGARYLRIPVRLQEGEAAGWM